MWRWRVAIACTVLGLTQAAAFDTDSPVGNAQHLQPKIVHPGRALAQSDGDIAAEVGGLFDNVEPCAPLLDIITAQYNSTSQWGNFTEPPTQALIEYCSEKSSAIIDDGFKLAYAVRVQEPQVRVMHATGPLVPPASNVQPSAIGFFVEGSIVVLDCRHNWVDLRELPLLQVDAVVVYLRCHTLTLVGGQGTTLQTWAFSSTSHLPCKVRSPLHACHSCCLVQRSKQRPLCLYCSFTVTAFGEKPPALTST
jgi:hypothetical protein